MIPRLVVITDWSLGQAVLLARLEAALGARVPIALQHRHHEATARAYFDEATLLKALCDRFAAPLFVSARLDVALALGTHLHLPSWALRPSQVRAALPADRWISVSVHDEDAQTDGASFALVSPVFPTASHPDAKPLGAGGLARLASCLRCPAYALGGVTAELAAGLPGVAVISAVLQSPDPALAVKRLAAALS